MMKVEKNTVCHRWLLVGYCSHSLDSDVYVIWDINYSYWKSTGRVLRLKKMEEKYSSNVLSGGQLGMVEVPSYR